MLDGGDDLVAGRYRLGALIGSGGSCDVRAATDLVLHRAVAIKLGRPGESDDLLGQSRLAARLDHPHVVHVLDAGTHGGLPYVVLDLVDGPTLAELLADGPLPLADVLAVAHGVLAGLAHAHALGVLHLDLSAGNVMVARGADGAPDPAAAVVLDFGAGQHRGVADGLLAVTPHYASPEVATGRAGDARSDVYSVGVLLFELATGRLPFSDGDARAVLSAHVHLHAAAPSSWEPSLPAAFDLLVARALAKDPAVRPAGADALLADVARLAGQVGPPTRRPTTGAGPRSGARRTTRPLAVVPPAGPALVIESTAAVGTPTATAVAPPAPPWAPARRTGAGWLAAVCLVLVVAVVAALSRTDDGSAAPPAPGATSVTPGVARTTRPPSAPPSPSRLPASTVPTVPADDIELPTLAGLTPDDARAALERVGLRLGGVHEVDGPTPGGTVVASSPAEGRLTAGSSVDLLVASGYTVVPEVAGLVARAATAALRESGLAATEVTVPDGIAGVAVRTTPQVGERLAIGYPVVLFVGSPPSFEVTPAPTSSLTPHETPSTVATPTPTGANP